MMVIKNSSNDDAGDREVSLKEYLMDTINERDRKYEQKFAATEKVISDLGQTIKEALATALASTKDALGTATENTRGALTTALSNTKDALTAIDKRFEAEALARAQIASQLNDFARKTEITQMLDAMEKAVVKADAATEKRFDSVNEFRAQLASQQETFARRNEVTIEVKGLSDRIAIIENMSSQQIGKAAGVLSIGNIIVVGSAALAAVVAVIALFLSRTIH